MLHRLGPADRLRCGRFWRRGGVGATGTWAGDAGERGWRWSRGAESDLYGHPCAEPETLADKGFNRGVRRGR